MQAVILAAGRGTRMGDLTKDCPKPMLHLLGKPLLEWKLLALPKEVDTVIFVIGYQGKCIRDHFGQEWKGKKIRYVEQEELNGTGGVLRLLDGIAKGFFLILAGDDLHGREDLERLLALGEKPGMLGYYVSEGGEMYGLLDTDKEGRLLSVLERPHGKKVGYMNISAYYLNEKALSLPLVSITPTEYGLPQTIAQDTGKYPVQVVRAKVWQPLTSPEDLPRGEEFLRSYGVQVK